MSEHHTRDWARERERAGDSGALWGGEFRTPEGRALGADAVAVCAEDWAAGGVVDVADPVARERKAAELARAWVAGALAVAEGLREWSGELGRTIGAE